MMSRHPGLDLSTGKRRDLRATFQPGLARAGGGRAGAPICARTWGSARLGSEVFAEAAICPQYFSAHASFPDILCSNGQSYREKKAKVFETLSYFDCVNFARQCKAAALFSVALMDEVCPPSTVYGAFNAYDGEKTIVEYEFNNHEGGQGYQEREQMAWVSGLFGVG
ncbi:acetylxylan esterase [Mesorhizobium dulcispinae]|uniref:acetylxylan esterase n=1 Tax=Mesorhizobium dulcispinae TaxID=3072316 RepID=UPI002A24D4DF|nr:acetylxylan esterase [Mesorhizobium sp. VK23D]MDX8518203.1 acetylxylan esterase [Mesorhizobium sp. VK23D]